MVWREALLSYFTGIFQMAPIPTSQLAPSQSPGQSRGRQESSPGPVICEIEVAGQRFAATANLKPMYDPKGEQADNNPASPPNFQPSPPPIFR